MGKENKTGWWVYLGGALIGAAGLAAWFLGLFGNKSAEKAAQEEVKQ